MIDALALALWMGGIFPAYDKCRAFRKSVFMSIIDAVAWPFGVGAWIVKNAFDETT